jgi:hypothetical protein
MLCICAVKQLFSVASRLLRQHPGKVVQTRMIDTVSEGGSAAVGLSVVHVNAVSCLLDDLRCGGWRVKVGLTIFSCVYAVYAMCAERQPFNLGHCALQCRCKRMCRPGASARAWM